MIKESLIRSSKSNVYLFSLPNVDCLMDDALEFVENDIVEATADKNPLLALKECEGVWGLFANDEKLGYGDASFLLPDGSVEGMVE